MSGALCGFAVNLFSNAVRKLPYMTKPHEHLLAIGIGGYAGYRMRIWEERQTAVLINELDQLGKSNAVQKKLQGLQQ